MKFKMSILIIFTIIVTLIAMYVLDNILIGAIVGFCIVFGLYIIPYTIYSIIKINKWNKILFVECDPVTYVEIGKSYLNNKYFNQVFIKINQSAGLIEMGEFEEAKAILLSINIDSPQLKHPTFQFVYYTNLMMSNLYLDNLDEATKIYQEKLASLNLNAKQRQLKQMIDAFYLFLTGNYAESKQYFSDRLNQIDELKPHEYINIIYYLAQIELIEGQIESAKAKLKEVTERGNLLYIAKQAKLQLESLD